MRKKHMLIFLVLLMSLCLLTSCVDTAVPSDDEIEISEEVGIQSPAEEKFTVLEDDDTEVESEDETAEVEETEEAIDEETAKYYSWLEGDWVMVSGMTDGWEYTADEVDFSSEVSFKRDGNKMIAHYVFEDRTFDAEVALVTEHDIDAMFYHEVEDRCIEFLYRNTDYPDTDSFHAVIENENTLHISQYYPMPGFPGAAHNTYARK